LGYRNEVVDVFGVEPNCTEVVWFTARWDNRNPSSHPRLASQ